MDNGVKHGVNHERPEWSIQSGTDMGVGTDMDSGCVVHSLEERSLEAQKAALLAQMIDCEPMDARVLPTFCGNHPTCGDCPKRPKTMKAKEPKKRKWADTYVAQNVKRKNPLSKSSRQAMQKDVYDPVYTLDD